jgi:NAD(P)-dependent dehydrogenase (short-subunit alcohol dehydrogenase family)
MGTNSATVFPDGAGHGMARLKAARDVFDLTGRGALVTGGGTHLGTAMARALATYGARVYIAGRRSAPLDETVAELTAEGLDVRSRVLDITDADQVDQVVADVTTELGDLSIMVCNAGASAEDQFPPDQPIQTFLDTLHSHLVGTFSCAQAAARSMRDAQIGGSIITVSSMQGSVASDPRLYAGLDMTYRSGPAYQSAKAGIIGLTRNLAAELGPLGIRANCISPGFIPKSTAHPDFVERGRRGNALGIVGQPDDLAGAVVLLASDAGRFINGHNLIVDGGWSIW